MRTLLPSSCCSPARLHLLLSALFFLTLLSPGKVAADYLGPQFRKLLGRSDKTLEVVLQIHKPNRMTTGEDGREIIPSPLAEHGWRHIRLYPYFVAWDVWVRHSDPLVGR